MIIKSFILFRLFVFKLTTGMLCLTQSASLSVVIIVLNIPMKNQFVLRQRKYFVFEKKRFKRD